MTYMVIVNSGHGEHATRRRTAAEALAEARSQIVSGAKKVSIRVTATGRDFSPDAFAEHVQGLDSWLNARRKHAETLPSGLSASAPTP